MAQSGSFRIGKAGWWVAAGVPVSRDTQWSLGHQGSQGQGCTGCGYLRWNLASPVGIWEPLEGSEHSGDGTRFLGGKG